MTYCPLCSHPLSLHREGCLVSGCECQSAGKIVVYLKNNSLKMLDFVVRFRSSGEPADCDQFEVFSQFSSNGKTLRRNPVTNSASGFPEQKLAGGVAGFSIVPHSGMPKYLTKDFKGEHQSYAHAKRRCESEADNSFKYYGAKGVQFRFKSFQDFMDELGPKPTPKHTVDRKDVKGHYEKGNVRWLTRADQQKNRTNTIFFTFRGKTQCLNEWAIELGMNKQTLNNRYKKGWCVPCLLTIRSGGGVCEYATDKRKKLDTRSEQVQP